MESIIYNKVNQKESVNSRFFFNAEKKQKLNCGIPYKLRDTRNVEVTSTYVKRGRVIMAIRRISFKDAQIAKKCISCKETLVEDVKYYKENTIYECKNCGTKQIMKYISNKQKVSLLDCTYAKHFGVLINTVTA